MSGLNRKAIEAVPETTVRELLASMHGMRQGETVAITIDGKRQLVQISVRVDVLVKQQRSEDLVVVHD